MQQEAPDANYKVLITQINSVRLQQKLGSKIIYEIHASGVSKEVSLLIFSNAAKRQSHGQICFIAGLLFGDFQTGLIYHVLPWTSHKSDGPTKSVGAAETFAAGESTDEGL